MKPDDDRISLSMDDFRALYRVYLAAHDLVQVQPAPKVQPRAPKNWGRWRAQVALSKVVGEYAAIEEKRLQTIEGRVAALAGTVTP